MPYYIGDDGEYYEIGNEFFVGQAARAPAFARGIQQSMMRRPQALPRALPQAALAAKRVSEGTLVKAGPPTRSEYLAVGFDSVTNVPSLATVQIISRPQQIFRPERLVIGASIAASFLVLDFKVGNVSQFLNSNPLPGETFSNQAFQVGMKMDTAQINSDLVLIVQNTSGGPLRFNASALGTTLLQ